MILDVRLHISYTIFGFLHVKSRFVKNPHLIYKKAKIINIHFELYKNVILDVRTQNLIDFWILTSKITFYEKTIICFAKHSKDDGN